MAGAHIIFPQFREEQSDSKYPFTDSATLAASSGVATLSNDIFIDAVFYPIGGGSNAHISQITVTTNLVTVTVATDGPEVLITGSYDPLRFTEDNSTIDFYDSYGRPAGVLIFNQDRIAEIYQWGFGIYTFDADATEFVATACTPANEPGVRAIRINGEEFITGDITLVGDAGVVLRAQPNNTIRVDVVGVPLFNRFACRAANKEPEPKRFVSTINGCHADEFGNFTITATNHDTPAGDDTTLRVYPTDYGLVIEAVGGSAV